LRRREERSDGDANKDGERKDLAVLVP